MPPLYTALSKTYQSSVQRLLNLSVTSLKSEMEELINTESAFYVHAAPSWEPPLKTQCLFRFTQNRNKLKHNLFHSFPFSLHPNSLQGSHTVTGLPVALFWFMLLFCLTPTGCGWWPLCERHCTNSSLMEPSRVLSYSPCLEAVLCHGSSSLYFQVLFLACLNIMVRGPKLSHMAPMQSFLGDKFTVSWFVSKSM